MSELVGIWCHLIHLEINRGYTDLVTRWIPLVVDQDQFTEVSLGNNSSIETVPEYLYL
jgi:hypothetical protein